MWNPYQFTGHPFFANPQHAILYPFNGLFFLLPFDLAFNAIIILHFFLGGLFTYLFLKDLKVNPTGSLVSGLIFMLSGYLLSVHSILSSLLSAIWTPLVMMFFRRAISRPGFKNEFLTGLFISLSFLGGGIEIVYGNFFVLLFMIIFSISLEAEVPEKSLGRRFLLGGRSFLMAGAIFFLISAAQILPFLELFRYSIRGGGISYQEATLWSFAPKDILLFFLPDAYGYFLDLKKYWATQCWLKTLYAGGLPFILGFFYFLRGQGRQLHISLMLFSFFLSLGHYNPLYPYLFKYLPFFNGIRYPVKFLYIFILSLSMVAGLGFQKLTDFSPKGENKQWPNFFLIFSLASGLLLLVLVLGHQAAESFLKSRGMDLPDFNHPRVNLHHAQRFLFYLTLFFLLLRVGQGLKWKRWVKGLLIFFLTADLFGNMGFYGKEKTLDYLRPTRILEWISSDRGFFRVFSTGKTISLDTPILIENPSSLNFVKEKHLPSLNLLYRLPDIWGIDVIRLQRVDDLYRVFTGVPSISATNLAELYGIKYVISVTPLEGDPKFELIYARLEGLAGKREDLLKENTVKLYRNVKYLPRGWLVKNFRVLEAKAVLSTMITQEFRPDREVLLEEPPTWANGSILPAGPSMVEFMSQRNNRLRLRVKTQENSLLVLSDTYFPGWKAYVSRWGHDAFPAGERREKKILRANYNFLAIPLEAGDQEVEFVYDPLSFKIGVLISLSTWVGITAYFIRLRGRRFKGSSRRQPGPPLQG